MIEIKVADEMDNAALAKIYYDIRLKEFVWEKEVCMDDFKKSTEGERILAGLVDGATAVLFLVILVLSMERKKKVKKNAGA